MPLRHPMKSLLAARLQGIFARASLAFAFVFLVVAIFLVPSREAQAVPAFARQTGQPCAACHTAFPELTPFGRRFKLTGYTMQGGDTNFPQVAAMLMPGFTHTEAKQDAPPAPGLKTNDNLVTQQVTGFYAGKVYGDLGAFIQVSGNPSNRINFFKANASYVLDHTYSLSAGYFSVNGTSDMGLYGANSVIGSPNSKGLVFDAAYLPFSHGSPSPYSSYNARIGVQYIKYLQLYGGTSNFDGMIGQPGAGGTHNASGNNTLFVYAWAAF